MAYLPHQRRERERRPPIPHLYVHRLLRPVAEMYQQRPAEV